jgi:hypothetical protein
MRSGQPRMLFFAAATVLLLLNYPWLSLFSSAHLLFGIPPLLLYLFGLWLGFILIIRALLAPSSPASTSKPSIPPPIIKTPKDITANRTSQDMPPDV